MKEKNTTQKPKMQSVQFLKLLKGFKFRMFDVFGTISNFHLKGNVRYQTKFGSLISILYIFIIWSSIIYYINKFHYKNDPTVGYVKYLTHSFPTVDLNKENLHFFWIVSSKNGDRDIPYTEFNKNFKLKASLYTVGSENVYDRSIKNW